ncbi:hypothetical protein [Pseudomonas indica]|uniref:hypothetical protein n=1 Tax=Pseudomonas indica TaxID=137658 RepID=UPI001140F605|nr:hypothetical protein [Pseudomonas indica]
MDWLIRLFWRFSCLLIFLVVSHCLDDVAVRYGNRQVAKYVLSDMNPARYLYSNDGVLLGKKLNTDDNKAVVVAAEHIAEIKRKTVVLRVGQQVLLCLIFSLCFTLRCWFSVQTGGRSGMW